MKKNLVRATTHQEVMRRLLKKPGFREGYEEELDKLRLAVAKVIVGARVHRRLSQEALARQLGVTQQQISKLENGDFDNLATLQKVLSLLPSVGQMKG